MTVLATAHNALSSEWLEIDLKQFVNIAHPPFPTSALCGEVLLGLFMMTRHDLDEGKEEAILANHLINGRKCYEDAN